MLFLNIVNLLRKPESGITNHRSIAVTFGSHKNQSLCLFVSPSPTYPWFFVALRGSVAYQSVATNSQVLSRYCVHILIPIYNRGTKVYEVTNHAGFRTAVSLAVTFKFSCCTTKTCQLFYNPPNSSIFKSTKISIYSHQKHQKQFCSFLNGNH